MRAEEVFKEFYEKSETPDDTALAIASSHRDARNIEDAFANALAWAEKIADPAKRERWRAFFLRALKRREEALEAARLAVEHDAENARAHYHLGTFFK